MRTIEGICPVCKEYSEVSSNENGCCNAGVIEYDGSRACQDQFADEGADGDTDHDKTLRIEITGFDDDKTLLTKDGL
jgi:hypothetical protein